METKLQRLSIAVLMHQTPAPPQPMRANIEEAINNTGRMLGLQPEQVAAFKEKLGTGPVDCQEYGDFAEEVMIVLIGQNNFALPAAFEESFLEVGRSHGYTPEEVEALKRQLVERAVDAAAGV